MRVLTVSYHPDFIFNGAGPEWPGRPGQKFRRAIRMYVASMGPGLMGPEDVPTALRVKAMNLMLQWGRA